MINVEQKCTLLLLDFCKAFDSVRHCELLKAVRKEGVFGKFSGAIGTMYSSLLSCVRMKNEYTDFFECPNGVRQGCLKNPTLFCMFINQLAEHVRSSGKHGLMELCLFGYLLICNFASNITRWTSKSAELSARLLC